ncbi:MAG TPA: hypothetical protein VL156_14095 [Terriglobales bacterium]|jgi:hypothetical protein|nr:hypothetical protein [Terriglobales bacterium]
MKSLCILCVLFGAVLPASALDREAFSFTRYELGLTLDPGQQRLGGRGKITLRNDSDSPQRSVALQISSSLHWAAIQMNGKSAEFVTQTYASDIDHTGALSEAIVTLSQPLAPGNTVELTVGYEGVVPQDTTRLTRMGVPADTAKHSDWDQISAAFTGLRGIGYVVWYPVATHSASMSDSASVSETVGRWKRRERDAEMRVSFSFPTASDRQRLFCDDGEPAELGNSLECLWRNLDTSIPFIVVSAQELLALPSFEIFYLPEHRSGAEDYAMALKQVGPSIAVWLGGRTPAKDTRGRVIDLPDSDAAPFESGSTFLMPLTADETSLLLTAVQQSVKLDFPSPRAWISQGLAGYAQLRYIEQEKSREAAQAYLEGHREALIDAERSLPERDPAAHSLINSVDEFYIRTKAMNVWWMLRELIGETALTAALHSYKPEEDKDAMYMQRLLEAQSHRDLTWFFDDWVYRDRGLPDFRVDSVFSREVVGGGYLVTVTVENLGGAGAEIPVILRMTTKDAVEKLVVPGKSKASVRILAGSAPVKTIVNDGGVPESNTRNNEYVMDH